VVRTLLFVNCAGRERNQNQTEKEKKGREVLGPAIPTTGDTIVQRIVLFGLSVLVACGILRADGPGDNIPEKVRQIPPQGVSIGKERIILMHEVANFGRELQALREALKGKPALLDLLPDVQIYLNAVHYALTYHEFFQKEHAAVAHKLLQQGQERARQLREGQAPWTTATGLVVRGYISKLDGSVQPYGLVVPASYRAGTAVPHRLDIWFHGRGETLSELAFIDGRQKSPGDFTPPHAFVLHPYGRYSNANHFAGEVDTFEALEHAKKNYSIDDNRITVRGFSMGGAACWHFAVHHAWRWAAAAPGAGFSETPEFLRVYQDEKLQPPWWEKKLWHLYDCNDWAINLTHCPTVAYSGDKDPQKQAADVMARAMAAEGITLEHIIGINAKHFYTAAAKAEINRRIDHIVARGRQMMPRLVRFTTWTLRYNRMHWVVVDCLAEHWEKAGVEAEIVDRSTVKVTTAGVTGLTLAMDAGDCPLDVTRPVTVLINGQKVAAAPVHSDRSWSSRFRLDAGKWSLAATATAELRKRHGLQGPIDDAFMDRFLFVRPTGKPVSDAVGKWVAGELDHALAHWRKQFRAELQPRDDTAVTAADIANSNLILWGDPSSNAVLAKIADKLPIRWTAENVALGKQHYKLDHHVPVLIYPNPLNPEKYVVLNSSFTFREYDYLNNARQVPKLPDWAILDVSQPPTSQRPAGIVTAGFFDESWRLPADLK
jgi:pimeloyl-ACP methyl ester carboxylesterase